jgi:hypothetical protein
MKGAAFGEVVEGELDEVVELKVGEFPAIKEVSRVATETNWDAGTALELMVEEEVDMEDRVDMVGVLRGLGRDAEAGARPADRTEDVAEANAVSVEPTTEEVMAGALDEAVALDCENVKGLVDESTDNADEERRSDDAVVAMVNAVVDTLSVEAEAAVEDVNKVWVGAETPEIVDVGLDTAEGVVVAAPTAFAMKVSMSRPGLIANTMPSWQWFTSSVWAQKNHRGPGLFTVKDNFMSSVFAALYIVKPESNCWADRQGCSRLDSVKVWFSPRNVKLITEPTGALTLFGSKMSWPLAPTSTWYVVEADGAAWAVEKAPVNTELLPSIETLIGLFDEVKAALVTWAEPTVSVAAENKPLPLMSEPPPSTVATAVAVSVISEGSPVAEDNKLGAEDVTGTLVAAVDSDGKVTVDVIDWAVPPSEEDEDPWSSGGAMPVVDKNALVESLTASLLNDRLELCAEGHVMWTNLPCKMRCGLPKQKREDYPLAEHGGRTWC